MSNLNHHPLFFLCGSRQHWFISRLDGAAVTAGGFSPQSSNVLIITTSSNQVYAFDVEAKQLGEWSRKNSFALPRRFQEFPGEVIGLSFPPSASSSSVIVYSSRWVSLTFLLSLWCLFHCFVNLLFALSSFTSVVWLSCFSFELLECKLNHVKCLSCNLFTPYN